MDIDYSSLMSMAQPKERLPRPQRLGWQQHEWSVDILREERKFFPIKPA
ncbi:MAG: hypothetical protein SOZ01_02130 [Selenomonadaceae bacterium]|nr:hypothetical protein [Selenomonadaceae bacterium]MDY3915531.1 hypothetical protein [Selenomonadaceae bacterium]